MKLYSYFIWLTSRTELFEMRVDKKNGSGQFKKFYLLLYSSFISSCYLIQWKYLIFSFHFIPESNKSTMTFLHKKNCAGQQRQRTETSWSKQASRQASGHLDMCYLEYLMKFEIHTLSAHERASTRAQNLERPRRLAARDCTVDNKWTYSLSFSFWRTSH